MPDKSLLTAKKEREGGVPNWMPLIGLMAAFVMAILVGATVCPTLSGIILPPDPRLPPGNIVERSHESLTKGDDEWLYGTNLDGCAVAKFYEQWLQDCSYAPNLTCNGSSTQSVIGEPENSYQVATCRGKQSVGTGSFAWTAYISSGYSTGDRTIFRLVREVGN
jgi:hypothetical protein